MTPSARLQSAIDILDAVAATAQPVDRLLRDWFRTRRYAGSKDRAAVSELVYAVLRHRSACAWRVGGGSGRSLVMGALLAEGRAPEAVAALFDGSAYGPSPLTAQEAHALASPSGDMPAAVRGEYPPFLEAELERAFGKALMDEMLALQERAPVDLRVNALKAARVAVEAELRQAGFAVSPAPYAPFGLRLAPGAGSARLSTLAAYTEGRFEFQDEAAQLAALLCGAQPGQRVLDLAAGAGGKTLALAAQMRNRGEIVAHDIAAERLQALEARTRRAGATIIHPTTAEPQGRFDLVLIDSPCSGSGTWRRQPELRWRTTPERLAELQGLQRRLLEKGARFVAPGGRLVYATCSILPSENEDIVSAFTAHGEFEVLPPVWPQAVGTAPPPGIGAFFKASPRTAGTDGFFTAVLQRRRWTESNAVA
ncbi:MAG: RsmB/NOP family class I SAM-dependent RNA methyltransferase [Alphaproteobacteria bacterium]|nr:RsmB/NOP family class I SAM-dependent RNA methyltransferase [Alphaproteobacteria bacterium]